MRHRARFLALCGGAAFVLGLAALPTLAQVPKGRTKGAAPLQRGDELPRVPAPPGVRVPNHFNQVEPPLTPEQRKRIYDIQARALRDSEAVLTPAQRASLDRLRAQGPAPRDDEATGTPTVKGSPSRRIPPGPDAEPPARKPAPPRDTPRRKAG